MELHNLKPAARSTKSSKRIGRGEGSGKGGTSTKGHKGAQSRSGYSRKVGFEGGQMPLYRLVPKRGFKNINRVEYSPINLSSLQALVNQTQATEIDLSLLIEHGLISKRDLVKVLGNGTLESKINISIHAISKSAREAIEKLGGTVTIIDTKGKAASEETPEN
ncbi:MAG TPA: 50S ribosomal protein L15 [Bacteroidales bacterium]|nr:50S ribosomal protein L15 [Bacteroidales bacterium]HOH23127.1 50S ribosomal protein L15 [Bacteroidales bacterium]HPB58093.1 50S ribosomal protein L15 [Bacteroidales bacterium]HPZ03741.1 50S ribosomal protein L15 [Bacteroidales bacterium]HQB75272.1 50S ribosomal protein L15 [Bacteroidales bacterium]